LPFQENQIVVN